LKRISDSSATNIRPVRFHFSSITRQRTVILTQFYRSLYFVRLLHSRPGAIKPHSQLRRPSIPLSGFLHHSLGIGLGFDLPCHQLRRHPRLPLCSRSSWYVNPFDSHSYT
jgi:hypothetical protein